jgi:predicted nucleic acid-binding protein
MGSVVDASVCAKWLFEEDHRSEALSLIASGDRLLAPDLLPAEIGSIIWKKCVRGQATASQAQAALSTFRNAPVRLTAATSLSRSALMIALGLRHSFYDCLYLALAREERVRMVTADRRLHDKVERSELAGLTLWIGDVP